MLVVKLAELSATYLFRIKLIGVALPLLDDADLDREFFVLRSNHNGKLGMGQYDPVLRAEVIHDSSLGAIQVERYVGRIRPVPAVGRAKLKSADDILFWISDLAILPHGEAKLLEAPEELERIRHLVVKFAAASVIDARAHVLAHCLRAVCYVLVVITTVGPLSHSILTRPKCLVRSWKVGHDVVVETLSASPKSRIGYVDVQAESQPSILNRL